MRAKAIAVRPLVTDELVALVREGARAVRLELLARASGVEIRAGLLAGLVRLAIGLEVFVELDVSDLVGDGAIRLQDPPASTKKGCGISAGLREQRVLTAAAKNVPHVQGARRVHVDLTEVQQNQLVRHLERLLHAGSPEYDIIDELGHNRV